MATIYRPAQPDDLERANELVAQSTNDLTERHGFGPMPSLRSTAFQRFCLHYDADGLWVAEDAGQILGFAFSWVCGDLWFLAQLFVAPGQQGSGIGNELLSRTLAHARKSRAANKALITFAFNRVSQGLYIRAGLFPRLPLYLFSVPREVLQRRLRGVSLAHFNRLEDSPECLRDLTQTDAHIL